MVNDSTREYSVYVSDSNNTINGSGVLFYTGGDSMFVFTCAHVVDDLDKIRLFILKAIDVAKDLYDVFCTEVPSSQIVFSPLDKVEISDGEKVHSEDLAIIQVSKPTNMEISRTDYFVTETYRTRSVYVQGYPNGVPEGRHPIEYLDCLHGNVVVNQTDSNRFTIRLDDTFIDQGARVCELKGLSGAPVWDDNEDVNGLLGLLASAYEANALLSKVRTTKSQQIRSIMMERFNVVIERKLEGIPEKDVAGNDFTPTMFDGTVPKDQKSESEKWIQEQMSAFRVIVEDLKLQKAIDRGRELIIDPRYESLSKNSKLRIKQYLLYCYEIADMDEEFEALEAEMRNEGLIKEHDILRQLTRSFMKRDFSKTVEAAQHYIDTRDESERDSLMSFAKAFLLFARAYTDDLPIEETIGMLLDKDDNFIFATDTVEDSALIYQMIGYVYGEKYHDYVNAVRFLNRSYRIGFDSMVLESLGAAYYFLGICDASDKKGFIPDPRKIDQKSIYKARECFLIIRGKADELFWSGTMRRMGMCVYNTFVFLSDNYRIITIYDDVKKYPSNLTDEEWRDVEMKYAKIIAQKGEINTAEYPHITTKDRILLDAIAVGCRCSNHIEDVTANIPNEKIKGIPQFAREIKDTIRTLENEVRKVDRRERVPIYVQMINIYGPGMLLLGWKKKDKLNDLYNRLSEYADVDLLETMSNFIFEMDAPIDESIKRFKATFDKKKNIITWQELNHLYVRHGMFEEADQMYRELLSERKELIEEGPEYAYRAFIEYVTFYKRDLKYALQCYLDAKEAFQDTDIEGFLELELMLYSSTFNEAERFEIERKQFVEKGLIAEEQYHRAAFIAYLANLNDQKAAEHNNYIRKYPHYVNPKTGMLIMNREEIHFLNWIGAIQPDFLPRPDNMIPQRSAGIRVIYGEETWHRSIDKALQNQIGLDKAIAIDAWGLYQLIDLNKIGLLDKFDSVFASHLTVVRLLEELSRTNNGVIRRLLDFLKTDGKVRIHSAGFKAQLEVRNVAKYFEPASTVAIGVEQGCVVVLGELRLDGELIDHFNNRIIRVSEIDRII